MEDSRGLVAQGLAGTGAAVIFDNNHFNPVAFAEKTAERIRTEKETKAADRAKLNKDIAEGFDYQPKGMLFQDEIMAENDKGREMFAKPEYAPYLLDPTNEVGKGYNKWQNQMQGLVNQADDITQMATKEMEALKKNPEAYDPESADKLRQLFSGEVSLAEARKLYSEGSILQPAYDPQDLADQLTYKPTEYTIRRSGGMDIHVPVVDEAAISTNIDGIFKDPRNKRLVDSVIKQYGSEEEAKKKVRSLTQFEPIVNKTAQSTGGGGGGKGGDESGFGNDKVRLVGAFDKALPYQTEGEANSIKVAQSNGRQLPPSTYTVYNDATGVGTEVFMTPSSIVKKKYPNGDMTYVIKGTEAKRTGETTKDINEASKFDAYVVEKDANGDDVYVEIKRFAPTEAVLTEENAANFEAQTGINVWDAIKRMNNMRGANKPKQASKQTSSKPKMSLEEYRKLPLAERMKIPVNERPTQ